MDFIPHTPDERKEMLKTIGLTEEEELFRSIPQELTHPKIPFPRPLTEMEMTSEMEDLAQKNEGVGMFSFLGGGAYDHFIPQAVPALLSRGDFVTAYTPYQAEASQGTLQFIYEFQTIMCRMTGMEIANASMYDGASALAEAALMACRVSRKEKIAVSSTVNPHYRRVLKTYMDSVEIELFEIPQEEGVPEVDVISKHIDQSYAAVFVQNPNYFGIVEPMAEISQAVKTAGSLLGVVVYPLSLSVLKAPATYEADIVLGDLQSLGIPLSYGGPYAGFIACKKKYVRQIPGRLVGRTTDEDGKTGYVLTLQTREQHIRRAKATSNICTNQSLCALASTIYVFTMGAKGLHQAAQRSVANAHTLQKKLCEVEGVKLLYDQPYFNEFLIELPVPVETFIQKAKEKKIIPGIPVSKEVTGSKEALLVCATEKNTHEGMSQYVDVVKNM